MSKCPYLAPLAALLALAPIPAGAAAQEPAERNVGSVPVPSPQPAPWDLATRRERLRQYLAAQRAELEIVATTVTETGQVIDWIPRESQVPGGSIATPPPLEPVAALPGEELARFELVEQPHARGPAGTVPVLRRDVDEVLNGERLPATVQDFLSKYGRAGDRSAPGDEPVGRLPMPGEPDHEYAHLRQYVTNYGSRASISLWNPYVYKSDEFSLGQVAVSRGTKGGKQTVEAGWQDLHMLYGDHYPHFFVFYTTNGYDGYGDNVGGYNRDVKGWVQYSPLTFPGARLTSVSHWGGPQATLQVDVRLYKGNWWVRANNEWVGYYPASLFSKSGLRYQASQVSWYGEVVDVDDGINSYTDMGSGLFAEAGWTWAAYVRNIRYYSGTGGQTSDFSSDVTTVTDPGCYSLVDRTHPKGSGFDPMGRHFWFGGPGKNKKCQ